eukprot:12137300-Ditylum_brightwellii.AAC.1
MDQGPYKTCDDNGNGIGRFLDKFRTGAKGKFKARKTDFAGIGPCFTAPCSADFQHFLKFHVA